MAGRSSTIDVRPGPKDAHSTVLSIEDEAIIVAFRKHTLLPLDDCLSRRLAGSGAAPTQHQWREGGHQGWTRSGALERQARKAQSQGPGRPLDTQVHESKVEPSTPKK